MRPKWLTKENILVTLAVLTFGIPVIPVGGFIAYSHFFPSNNTASSSSSTIDEGEDDPLRPTPSYESETDSYEESRGSSDCTSDCSGHEAGYEWGEENDICDTDYDNGNSESFNEGVRAWAEDNCSSSYDDGEDSDYYY